jgi:hypothetical protein
MSRPCVTQSRKAISSATRTGLSRLAMGLPNNNSLPRRVRRASAAAVSGITESIQVTV